MKTEIFDNDSHDRPGSPPVTVDHYFDRSGHRFQIGHAEGNTICVEASLWTGLKTRSLNAAGNSALVQRGPCRFEVGERERHEVVVQVDKTARVNVLVDGRRVGMNLFPRLRAVILILVSAFSAFLFVVIYKTIEWAGGG